MPSNRKSLIYTYYYLLVLMKSFLSRKAVIVTLVVLLSLALGLFIGAKFLGHSRDNRLDKLNNIVGIIDNNYVDEINVDSLLELSIPDLLAKLDPHSEYIPASTLQSVNDELEGSFSGIGVSFNMLNDTITVVEVIPGGPSEKVGILAGDRIITINDSVVHAPEWSTDRVIKNLKGPKGTEVNLEIIRNTSKTPLKFTVVRDNVPMNSVDASYMLADNIGYMKVNKFGRTTYSEFLNGLLSLKNQGATQVVLDLRGNGGGFMEPAILMANEFLKAGSPIVSTRGRTFEEPMICADGTGAFTDMEIAILLDEFSASSSEIFTGAIQDNDRGLIIGRRSFGKGLVQNQYTLPDSSAMRLTIARYYTPSGRCIQKTFTPGDKKTYGNEIIDRFTTGEVYNADSVHLDKSHTFYTTGGREVYGGGGIMPDVYVPNDTSGITSYYINVFNAGLIQKYAFAYSDMNRADLHKANNVEEIMTMLPSNDQLLQDFVLYAKTEGGISPRWYYINISGDLIVNQLKALIARDALGMTGYYQIINQSDSTVARAIKELNSGNAEFPIKNVKINDIQR